VADRRVRLLLDARDLARELLAEIAQVHRVDCDPRLLHLYEHVDERKLDVAIEALEIQPLELDRELFTESCGRNRAGARARETLIERRRAVRILPIGHGQDGHLKLESLRREVLERVWPTIDAIEVFNAREAIANDNRRALAFSVLHGIPGAVGSDAHRPWEIGRAYIEISDFTGSADFIDSLKSGAVTGRLAGHAIHFYTRYDKWRKWWSRRGSRTT
jgi:predicted metal-dependent phosphoesterase TrpH